MIITSGTKLQVHMGNDEILPVTVQESISYTCDTELFFTALQAKVTRLLVELVAAKPASLKRFLSLVDFETGNNMQPEDYSNLIWFWTMGSLWNELNLTCNISIEGKETTITVYREVNC